VRAELKLELPGEAAWGPPHAADSHTGGKARSWAASSLRGPIGWLAPMPRVPNPSARVGT